MSQHGAMPPYIMSACSRMFVFLSDHFRNVFKKYENMAVVTRLIKARNGRELFILRRFVWLSCGDDQ